jgi:hypothetical protein
LNLPPNASKAVPFANRCGWDSRAPNFFDKRREIVFPMRVEYEDHVCNHAAAGAIQGT